MEFGLDSSDENRYGSLLNRGAPDVRVIVKVAHEELRRLLQERAGIMRRIGTIKQTISGLCNLFGDGDLTEDLRELVNGKAGVRRPLGKTAFHLVGLKLRSEVVAPSAHRESAWLI